MQKYSTVRKNLKLTAIFATIAIFIFVACNSNDANKPDTVNNFQSTEFCKYVSEGKFEITEGVGKIINDFLKEIAPELDDTVKMEKLRDWLNKMECVSDAEILCVSCVKTNPPHSELIATFSTQDGPITLGLCIFMGEPLVLANWHDYE